MDTMHLVFGIAQMVLCVLLIVVIVMQSGKSAGLSGSIGGGAETFFGKNKAKTMEGKLARWTTIFAVGFLLCTVALNGIVRFF